MIEALVGVLFAACFVTLYFLLSLLLGQREQRRSGARLAELYPPALRDANAVDTGPGRFKKTEELSRHHLVAGKASAPKMMKAGTETTGTGQRRSANRAS